MAACDYCGATILWGGTRSGDFVFCNEKCQAEGILVTLIDQIPSEITQAQLAQVHQGNCPACGGEGPIDVHTSHSATSAFVMTWWRSTPKVCCRRCGIKSQLGGLLWSGVLGWWGFPWGLIMTPVQILRNLGGIISPPNPFEPTAQLRKMVNLELASRLQDQLLHGAASGEPEATEDSNN